MLSPGPRSIIHNRTLLWSGCFRDCPSCLCRSLADPKSTLHAGEDTMSEQSYRLHVHVTPTWAIPHCLCQHSYLGHVLVGGDPWIPATLCRDWVRLSHTDNTDTHWADELPGVARPLPSFYHCTASITYPLSGYMCILSFILLLPLSSSSWSHIMGSLSVSGLLSHSVCIIFISPWLVVFRLSALIGKLILRFK